MKYVIYNMSDSGEINFSQVVETQLDTLRVSIDGTKTILKYENEAPNFLEGITTYTREEILQIINDPNNGWISND